MLLKRKTPDPHSENVLDGKCRMLVESTPFAAKESYVKVRTNLMFSMTADKTRNCRIFAVTSSNPHEGKSTATSNIAISFAMLGKKTLLIDCDMRKPTQHKIWGVRPKTGLCDYLGNLGPCETFSAEKIPLTIMCTGTIPPNPSELLASEQMKSLVRSMSEQYDYVIIDTPPVNTVADAQIVSTYVDGVVIITKSGLTTADDLRMTIKAIRQAGGNICGTVLNNIDMKSGKYSYKYGKYGYKYSYRYGKDGYEYKYGYSHSHYSSYDTPYGGVEDAANADVAPKAETFEKAEKAKKTGKGKSGK